MDSQKSNNRRIRSHSNVDKIHSKKVGLDIEQGIQGECCPVCKITYRQFRTGMTFASVKSDMYVSSENPDDWVYKRRNCVLRRWCKIKMMMWKYHLEACKSSSIEHESASDHIDIGIY